MTYRHRLGVYHQRAAVGKHFPFHDGKVTLRWKDYTHGGKSRLMTLSAEEVSAPFPPSRSPARVRPHPILRLLANRRHTALLLLCWTLLGGSSSPQVSPPLRSQNDTSSASTCPRCGGLMVVIERLTAAIIFTELARDAVADTS
jgi:hypothetical protein